MYSMIWIHNNHIVTLLTDIQRIDTSYARYNRNLLTWNTINLTEHLLGDLYLCSTQPLVRGA